MPDVALLETVGHFDWPPPVAALAQETFNLREVSAALEIVPERVSDFSKWRLQLVSPEVRGRVGRRYASIDVYCLALFNAFDSVFRGDGRYALVLEFGHLLFGDFVSTKEWRERRLIFAQDRARALSAGPRAKAKSDKMIAQMWEGRRRELQRSIFDATPLWWSRDLDRRFVLFVARNRELFQYIVDRNVNGGMIDPKPFEAAGMVFCLNATNTLAEIDKRLAAIVIARGGREFDEA
jgi:hypothetical protein